MSKLMHAFRKLGKGALVFCSLLLGLFILGTFWPQLIIFGQVGTIATSFWNLHVLILAVIFAIISVVLLRKNSTWLNKSLVVLNGLTILGSGALLGNQIQTAHQYDTQINWGQYLSGQVDMGTPNEKQSVIYTRQGGKTLKLQVTMPKKKAKSYKPVFMIHGGGYMAGSRNQQPSWVNYYQSKGYVVFDVDYHLASKSQHPWKQAPTDIALAIQYVQQRAAKYHVNMDKMVIAGSSAGGGIALQTAYGISDDTISVKGLPTPKAVVAIYPGSDPYALWHGNSSLLGMKGNICDKYYIGGSPDQYPERYAQVSPSRHITRNTPATLIVAGKNDHVIPYQGQQEFAQQLSRKNVAHKLVTLPYSDHFFDMAGGSVGSQIARQQATNFLNKHNR
ncbi:MAG TPA: alpha/beta hydrolase [Candidatus Levilactobacillus faecigallinarum]|uniref:Alpha/beta hydrolase n=1 Tax=Candidatus Levilactobacillus faecigallinarum TaxID=2838638 RepID=A0A9D1QTT8_9LACO|nr:alpha/beta hydrolase [Candidatus Levilactobacillus faecigallinarum]